MGIVTALSIGTTDITYTVGASFVTATVTVNYLPTIIAGISSMCSGLSTTWMNMQPGGVWTSMNNAIATIGSSTGVIVGVSGGNDTIWYTTSPTCYTGAIINIRQTPTISGLLSVPIGGTHTLTATPSGGIWATTATGITLGSSSGIVTGLSLGTDSITYYASGCPNGAFVTVTPTTAVSTPQGSSSLIATYPNPTTGQITLVWDCTAANSASLELSDAVGNIVYKAPLYMKAGMGSSVIELAGVSNGMYILNVKGTDVAYKSTIVMRR
jgi:hypothetical protein